MNFTPEEYLKKIKQSTVNSFKACGYQQLTVSGSMQKLTVPTDAKYALIIVESSETTLIVARYLEVGSPTVVAGTGLPLKDGNVFDITDTQNLVGFQVIQEAGYTTKLNIQYYK